MCSNFKNISFPRGQCYTSFCEIDFVAETTRIGHFTRTQCHKNIFCLKTHFWALVVIGCRVVIYDRKMFIRVATGLSIRKIPF